MSWHENNKFNMQFRLFLSLWRYKTWYSVIIYLNFYPTSRLNQYYQTPSWFCYDDHCKLFEKHLKEINLVRSLSMLCTQISHFFWYTCIYTAFFSFCLGLTFMRLHICFVQFLALSIIYHVDTRLQNSVRRRFILFIN